MAEGQLTINIKLPSGGEEVHSQTISSEATVLQLKGALVEVSGLKVEDQRLIFKGKILKDEMLLVEYKIENGVTVHLVQSSSSKGADAGSTKTAAEKTTAPATGPAAGGLGSLMGGLGGLPGMPPGMGGMPDPSQMASMLNNPEIQQVFSDPSFIQNMVDSNPFLKQMADANPMMKALLSDPEALKQMMNPESISAAMAMMGGGGGMPPGFPGMPGMGGMPGMPGMGMPGMGMPGMGMGMPGMGMPGMGMPGMGMPGMGMGMPGMGMPGMGGMMGMNPMMMGMMGANPFGPRPGVPQAAPQHDMSKPPKERYAKEIEMVKMFGISATDDEIVKALTDSNGDMEKAMETLFKGEYDDEDDAADK